MTTDKHFMWHLMGAKLCPRQTYIKAYRGDGPTGGYAMLPGRGHGSGWVLEYKCAGRWYGRGKNYGYDYDYR